MSLFTSNPEYFRYARAQLRINKVLATALICFVLSVSFAFLYMHIDGAQSNPSFAGSQLLQLAFILQVLVLGVGGGITCLNSIYSEKEQNTFDYQRITRLSSMELALGKLFGAPLLMYFICLCLAPLTFYAAVVAGAHLQFVLAAYVVLLVASITFHCFTLLLSLFSVKGSQVSGIILALLLLWFASVDFSYGYLQLHPLGPFEAPKFATASAWIPDSFVPSYYVWPFTDLFFGHRVDHFFVLLIIDSVLALCFFLGVVRNIKKTRNTMSSTPRPSFSALPSFSTSYLQRFTTRAGPLLKTPSQCSLASI